MAKSERLRHLDLQLWKAKGERLSLPDMPHLETLFIDNFEVELGDCLALKSIWGRSHLILREPLPSVKEVGISESNGWKEADVPMHIALMPNLESLSYSLHDTERSIDSVPHLKVQRVSRLSHFIDHTVYDQDLKFTSVEVHHEHVLKTYLEAGLLANLTALNLGGPRQPPDCLLDVPRLTCLTRLVIRLEFLGDTAVITSPTLETLFILQSQTCGLVILNCPSLRRLTFSDAEGGVVVSECPRLERIRGNASQAPIKLEVDEVSRRLLQKVEYSYCPWEKGPYVWKRGRGLKVYPNKDGDVEKRISTSKKIQLFQDLGAVEKE